jgi:pyridoxamine 5'-phosphate oxidase
VSNNNNNDKHADLSLADMRQEYDKEVLLEADAGDDPIALFGRWFEAAEDACPERSLEPNMMTIATADPAGWPDARIVLLKGFDAAGFVWFTNYNSAKARQLQDNPRACLVLHWHRLERQVRIQGRVEKISREDSQAYFQRRRRESQIGAWVSHQSEITTLEKLEARFAELERKFEGQAVPCPPHWGGYIVQPLAIEFWQGRPGRMHDRLRFRRDELDQPWTRERLAP